MSSDFIDSMFGNEVINTEGTTTAITMTSGLIPTPASGSFVVYPGGSSANWDMNTTQRTNSWWTAFVWEMISHLGLDDSKAITFLNWCAKKDDNKSFPDYLTAYGITPSNPSTFGQAGYYIACNACRASNYHTNPNGWWLDHSKNPYSRQSVTSLYNEYNTWRNTLNKDNPGVPADF